MLKLVVGLGNPGQQYEKTRHNAGFLFLDGLAERYSCVWLKAPQFQGIWTECQIEQTKVLLLKPQTFMNRSGQSVGRVARYYKLAPDQILVAHDELDFAPGVLRLKKDGGHAGHNGLRDIITHLNSSNFNRLRIGIGRPPAGMAVADYVLSSPSNLDYELIKFSANKGIDFIPTMIKKGVGLTMNEINRED